MAEERRPGHPPEQEEGRGGDARRGVLSRIMEALGLESEPEGVPQGSGVLTGVNFASLINYIIGERERVAEEKSIEEARVLLNEVSALSRELVDVFGKDGLGRIVHPVYGDKVVDSRLGIIALLLAETVGALWHRVQELVDAKAPVDEVARAARVAERASRMAPMLLAEAYNKLVTLYYVNAPPRGRPPLVNAAMGYEVLD